MVNMMVHGQQTDVWSACPSCESAQKMIHQRKISAEENWETKISGQHGNRPGQDIFRLHYVLYNKVSEISDIG